MRSVQRFLTLLSDGETLSRVALAVQASAFALGLLTGAVTAAIRGWRGRPARRLDG
jgi:hypothetical protein